MTQIKLNCEQWKTEVKHLSRGRMELRFRLNQDEALAFNNFMKSVKPDDMGEDVFLKMIFLKGIDFVYMQLQEFAREQLELQKNVETAMTPTEPKQ